MPQYTIGPLEFSQAVDIISERYLILLRQRIHDEAMVQGLIQMLSIACLPPDHFTKEQFDEYQSMMDGKRAEAIAKLNEMRGN